MKKKLGFGLMRLPKLDGEIDIAQVNQMVDLFLERGFDYFDTAYGYNAGKSEAAAKTCIVDRHPRESFRLATKLPVWGGAKNAEEAKAMFYTSLERTGAGYFDRYLLHNLGGTRTKLFEDYGMWEFTAGLKAQGLVRELGFSIHDNADALDRILTEHPDVDFVQLQINYADWDDPVVESRKCYETAVKHNKPVIIMEPVKGGSLADPPHGIRDIMEAAAPGASPSSWAIRFAASLEHADVVLSGMSNLEQLRDNISYMEDFRPLSAEEYAVIDRAREILASVPTVPCTSCRYCTDGCPMKINIPGVFAAYNTLLRFSDVEDAKDTYKFRTKDGGKASDCIACGACESVCPQHIEIIEALKKAASALE